jgi:Asp-tRNA(Asn)/Glu-tRNA(Gln) amidotransferase A subunit family amidase
VSAVDAVRAAIDRLDPSWLIGDRVDRALRQAEDCDRRYPPGSWLPPLAGVPLLVDARFGSSRRSSGGTSVSPTSAPTRSASVELSNDEAYDHPIVDALVRDGAIVVGLAQSGVSTSNLSSADDLSKHHVMTKDLLSPGQSDPFVLALRAGAVVAGVSVDDPELMLVRAAMGLDGYRPTLGFAPSVDYPNESTSVLVASTLAEQAYLLDRLRAMGVAGDPRFLPHSNPKSLASFAMSATPPLRIARWVDDDHRRGNEPDIQTAAEAKVMEVIAAYDIHVDTMGGLGSSRAWSSGIEGDGLGEHRIGEHGVSWVSGSEPVEGRSSVIAAVDRVLATVDAIAAPVLLRSAIDVEATAMVWRLPRFANLPMVVLADAELIIVGSRFGDAHLMRIAAWFSETMGATSLA